MAAMLTTDAGKPNKTPNNRRMFGTLNPQMRMMARRLMAQQQPLGHQPAGFRQPGPYARALLNTPQMQQLRADLPSFASQLQSQYPTLVPQLSSFLAAHWPNKLGPMPLLPGQVNALPTYAGPGTTSWLGV